MTLKRWVAGVLLTTMTSACMTTARVAPAEYLRDNQPLQMMVVDEFGDFYVLEQPQLVGNRVVGIEVGTPDTVALEVSEVQQALVKKKSPQKTALLVGTLTALTTGAVIFALNMGSAPPCKTPGDASLFPELGKDHCDPSLVDNDGGDPNEPEL